MPSPNAEDREPVELTLSAAAKLDQALTAKKNRALGTVKQAKKKRRSALDMARKYTKPR